MHDIRRVDSETSDMIAECTTHTERYCRPYNCILIYWLAMSVTDTGSQMINSVSCVYKITSLWNTTAYCM